MTDVWLELGAVLAAFALGYLIGYNRGIDWGPRKR